MKSTLIFIFCLTVITIPQLLQAQSNSDCPVLAKILPASADSVVPLYTSIEFSSASQNATSYTWLYQGGFAGSTNRNYNYSTSVGIQRISLVATNGTCSDTATVVYFTPGTPHNVDSSLIASYGYPNTNDYPVSIAGTPDGGFLLGGDRQFYNPCGMEGIVIKMRDRGCVDWSRSVKDLTDVYCKHATINNVHGGLDGSYSLSIQSGFETVRLDNNGNQVWINRWQVDGLALTWLVNYRMTSDPAGNLYVVGHSLYNGITVAKIDPAGNIAWNKYFRLSSRSGNQPYLAARGIVWVNGKIYISALRYAGSPGAFMDNVLIQLNASDGLTGWKKSYNASGIWYATNISTVADYILLGGPGNGQSAAIIDQQGNVINGMSVFFPGSNYTAKETSVVGDNKGNIYFSQWVQQTLPLQPGFANYNNFAKIDLALNKHWGMVYSTTPGGGYFVSSATNSQNGFGALIRDYGLVGESSLGSIDLRFLRVDSVATQNYISCDYNSMAFNISPLSVTRGDFQWDADSTLSFTRVNITNRGVQEGFVQSRYTCPDFIDSCNFLKISGPQNLCNPSLTYTYRIHKNKRCALPLNWRLPSGVTVLNETDTSITLKFPGFGQFNIRAALNSCVPQGDSLRIVINRKYDLNLGKDTSICNNAPIVLRAGRMFYRYNWSNGSTDSILTVTQPGVYWAEVTDTCGNILRDSIRIENFNIPINIGPDRIKCNADTIRLSAPAGFMRYEWSNNYNINSTNSQNVIVNPFVDTSYFLRAEKLPGCFSFDTVKIKVNRSPVINLGKDTSFCEDQTVLLDAGPGFTQYLWSNGAGSREIAISNKGYYSVIGTTTDGCKSFDTVQIANIWKRPSVEITGDSLICEGGSRTINAVTSSPGTSYLWNDGSVASKLEIRLPGKYSVKVTDDKGCSSLTDFVATGLVPVPEKFLPADSLLCSYGKMELKALSAFNSYLWSTQQSSQIITISLPGQYWLQVTDKNNCIGRDTIIIGKKDCLEGLFVPNAFTPNGDGRNDFFKAMLFGNVKSFEMTIFNRWGQMIFRSTDPMKGWNGLIGGKRAAAGIFVWMIRYQMEGQPAKTERGTVTLIQ